MSVGCSRCGAPFDITYRNRNSTSPVCPICRTQWQASPDDGTQRWLDEIPSVRLDALLLAVEALR